MTNATRHRPPPANADSHGGVPHAPRQHVRRKLHVPRFHVARPSLSLHITSAGWLQGPGVRLEQRPPLDHGTGWHDGHPIGFLNHFTDGCGDPLGTLYERHVSAHGCTLQDGTLVQYIPFTELSWHAYGAAYYFIGWENAAAPGAGCDFTRHQLDRLAELNAAALMWIYQHYGVGVPTKRSPGVAYAPGIKCHADGLEHSSVWDRNGHWDAPWRATGDPISKWVDANERRVLDRSPYTSSQFIARVQAYRGK